VFADRVGPVLLVSLGLGACTSTYHPEYHPESSYKYVQNVVYAQNLVVRPPDPKMVPIDLEMAAPYVDLWGRGGAKSEAPASPPPPQRPAPHGKLTSPGGVVIYGDVYGDIFFNR
jgi:hypothetical protein